jgi:hypothetical protein
VRLRIGLLVLSKWVDFMAFCSVQGGVWAFRRPGLACTIRHGGKGALFNGQYKVKTLELF